MEVLLVTLALPSSHSTPSSFVLFLFIVFYLCLYLSIYLYLSVYIYIYFYLSFCAFQIDRDLHRRSPFFSKTTQQGGKMKAKLFLFVGNIPSLRRNVEVVCLFSINFFSTPTPHHPPLLFLHVLPWAVRKANCYRQRRLLLLQRLAQHVIMAAPRRREHDALMCFIVIIWSTLMRMQ